MNAIQLHNGYEVFTGLQEVASPELKVCSGLPVFEDTFPLLSEQEILDLITDPKRVPASVQFPANKWIGRQTNNACCGYATAGAGGRIRVRAGLDPVVLSGEYVYCNINGGRDRGAILADGMQFIVNGGSAPVEMVPVGIHLKRDIPQSAIAEAANFKAIEGYVCKTKQALYSGLAIGFVGVIAVHVDRDFSDTDQYGRVPPSDGPGNHAVCVDDLIMLPGSDEPTVCSPNSWGVQWGFEGRGRYTWERHLRTTCKYHEFYLLRGTAFNPRFINLPNIRQ